MSDRRYNTVVLGSPGTGKSTFLGSVADVVGVRETLLLATKPRESNSFGYTTRDVDFEVHHDAKWRPSIGKFEANGFLTLLNRLWDLYEDEKYGAVLVDAGTDVGFLIMHEVLKKDRAATPKDLGKESESAYGAVKHLWFEFTQALTALSIYDATGKGPKRPKHVVMSMHTQPAKEDERVSKATGKVSISPDKVAKGVEFEGNVLPAIEGGYRRTLTADFDIVCYSDIVFEIQRDAKGKMLSATKVPRYVLQVAPDEERHAKVGISRLLPADPIDNNFAALLAAVEKARAA